MLEFDNIYRRNAVSVNIPILQINYCQSLPNYWNLSTPTSYINTSTNELKDPVLHLKYECRVYSNDLHAYFIENGNYTATIGDTTRSESNIVGINPFSKPNTRFYFSMMRHLSGYISTSTSLIKPDFVVIGHFPILTFLSVLFTGLIFSVGFLPFYIIFQAEKKSQRWRRIYQ